MEEFKHQTPDYVAIKREIQDKNSKYYYPLLWERFLSDDPSMEQKDYHYFYYGYLYSDYYLPDDPESDTEQINKYLGKEQLSDEDITAMIELLDKAHREYPFSFKRIDLHYRLYELLGAKEKASAILNRFSKLMDVIVTTGNGISMEKAIHVISVPHEYFVMSCFKFKPRSQSLIDVYDKVEIEMQSGTVSYIHFHVGELLKKTNELLGF